MPTAVIFGATGDIGSACASLLAASGWNLVLFGRDEAAMSVLARDVSRGTTMPRTFVGDVENPDAFSEMLRTLVREIGQLDAVVWAIGRSGTRGDLSDWANWRTTVDVNAIGAAVMLQVLGPSLQHSSGSSVVMVSSLAAREGFHRPDYAASKAALDAITRSFAVSLGPSRVRVNAVAPGPVMGRMLGHWSEERMKEYERLTPLGVLASPADVAAVVGFLLSTDAAHITGAVIPVDGGLGCRLT